MRGWHSGRQSWQFGGRDNWWVPLLVIGSAILLFSKLGWSWWWLLFFWWVIPAMFGGWSHSRGGQPGTRDWARGWSRWGMCGGTDDEQTKHKYNFSGDKPKRDDVYLYRENGDVLEVRDAPEKPKRSDEYV